ncbi:MAG: hypothetical protein JWQ75_3920 [Pseudarthrobacter sp.]|nr:hypothetical protein [Pseudarthrobacter sp.]
MLLSAAGFLACAATLSACTGAPQPGPAPSTAGASSSSPAAAAPSSAPASAAPAGAQAASPAAQDPATAALQQTVTDVLNRLAAGSPKPATAQLGEALAGAGIPAAALEVSESRTPTGLEADAIEAAVLQGSDCVIGQIRDGSVTVTVLPVLASGKCFVGTPA